MSVRALPGRAETISDGVIRRTRAQRVLRQVKRRPIETAGLLVILGVVFMAVFADVIAPSNYAAQDFASRLQPMSAQHFFGTDSLGRDVFSRIIYGARTSMMASTMGVLISGLIGGLLGITSGYAGGWFDLLEQRVTDSIRSVPLLLMAMILIIALSGRLPSLFLVSLALGLIGATTINRVVRGSTLAVKESPYVEAATSLGASGVRVVLRHIFPNVLAPLIVACSIQFGAFITAEAALSFLGLGVQPPMPSWGGMLSADGRAFFLRAPWLAIFPGVAISLTVLATNLVGDALRDILDPRQRGS